MTSPVSARSVKQQLIARSPSLLGHLFKYGQSSSLGSRLARSTFWSFAGTALSRGLSIVASFAIARLLGLEGFGQLGIIQSTVGMFQAFAGLALGLTATKYVAEFRVTDPARAGRIIGFSHVVACISGGLASVALFALAGWLSQHTLAAPQLAPFLRISAPILLLSALAGSQNGALAGFEAFRKLAQINFWCGIANFPLMLCGVYFAGLAGVVWAMLANTALNCVLSQVELRRQAFRHHVSINYRHAKSEAPILWNFTLPAVLAGIVVQPVNWLCNTWLVNSPAGYEQMGLLAAASAWRTAMMFIPGIAIQAVLPIMSSAQSEGKVTPEFQRALTIAQAIMTTVGFPLAIILMFFSDSILLLYGKGFQGAGSVIIGTVGAALIGCIGAAAGPAIDARGKMWFGVTINVSWGALCLAFVYLTVAKWGANSLAYGPGFAYVITTIGLYLYMKPVLPPGMLSRVLWSLVAAGIAIAAAALANPHTRLLLAGPAFAGAVLTVYALNGSRMRAVYEVLRHRATVFEPAEQDLAESPCDA